ncbi:hypothetical protein PAERUG_E15_London_28_01_14_01638 [Pseudomonas aeruginosa]|jgi:hypothetical protein|nr:hypothetical protein PAERUG_E15_London_28_01_14_01638 [Pseudomonas aeruginosa]
MTNDQAGMGALEVQQHRVKSKANTPGGYQRKLPLIAVRARELGLKPAIGRIHLLAVLQ